MSRIRRLARRRSLQWVAGGLVLLLALWLAVRIPAWRDRQAGIAEHAAVHQRLRDQGLDVTVADRLARLPALDPQRQAEAKRMLGCGPGTPNWQPAWVNAKALSQSWSVLHRREQDPWLNTPPTDVQAVLKAAGPDLDALAALLAQGPVVVSSLAWCRDSLPDPDQAGAMEIAAMSNPGLSNARGFMNGFLLQAQAAADPRGAVTDARRLRDAYLIPGTLLDCMIGLAISAIHDRGMLDLLQRRRLPEDLYLTWLAEPPMARTVIADAFAGERVFYGEAAYRLVATGRDIPDDVWAVAMSASTTPVIGPLSAWWERTQFNVASWRHGPLDLAHHLGWLAQAETGLRTGNRPPEPTGLVAEVTVHGGIQSIILPNLLESAHTAQFRHDSHRLCRAAGRVLWAWQQPGRELPVDEAAFLTLQPIGSCDQGPGASRIRYVRLAADRFQVYLDPEAAAPGWDLEQRIREGLNRDRKTPGSSTSWTSISIDLSDPRTPEADF